MHFSFHLVYEVDLKKISNLVLRLGSSARNRSFKRQFPRPTVISDTIRFEPAVCPYPAPWKPTLTPLVLRKWISDTVHLYYKLVLWTLLAAVSLILLHLDIARRFYCHVKYISVIILFNWIINYYFNKSCENVIDLA